MNHIVRYYCVFLAGITLAWIGSIVHHKTVHNIKPRLTVVCTTSILADTVRNLVGEHAKVISLMNHDVDPHLYRAKEHDLHAMLDADLIIYHGLHLEGKLCDLLEKMNTYRPTYNAATALHSSHLIPLHAMSDHNVVYDPHVWFDITLWIKISQGITNKMQLMDPRNHSAYQILSDAYQEKLTKLDSEIRTKFDLLPQSQKILVTAHDAFHYFGKAYGCDVVALQGISTDSEAGIYDVQKLATYIIQSKIKTIFVESSIPQKSLLAVQEACHAQGWNVTVGKELYSDALGHETSEANTYEHMILYNAMTIYEALL